MKQKTATKTEPKIKLSPVRRGRAPAPDGETKSRYTAFRCPLDILELAKVKAKKQRRSLSNYIITLIEREAQIPEESVDES
ncbi:MAG: hypothetical protein JWL90_4616 [Chthoniobacteraceae bacterium]|nr:hypothetical protein [Chthoniobacteraceae bacterium]